MSIEFRPRSPEQIVARDAWNKALDGLFEESAKLRHVAAERFWDLLTGLLMKPRKFDPNDGLSDLDSGVNV